MCKPPICGHPIAVIMGTKNSGLCSRTLASAHPVEPLGGLRVKSFWLCDDFDTMTETQMPGDAGGRGQPTKQGALRHMDTPGP